MAVDSLNVGEALCAIPEQLAASHELAGKIHRDALPSADDFDHIVTLGMGGSGIAGDILQAVGTATLPMPLAVLKHYRTPAFIGERTLAFALSYSGDTEETLEMARGALSAGARLITLSRGGELEELARRARRAAHRLPDGVPVAAVRARVARGTARGRPLPDGPATRGPRHAAQSPGTAPAPARPVRARCRPVTQSGARAGAQDRAHDPDHLRRRWVRRGGGDAVEVLGQRERQGARLLERLPGARPQRDLRVGPARRRHPSDVHDRRAAPGARAPATRTADDRDRAS